MRQKLVKEKTRELHKVLRESCSECPPIVVSFQTTHICGGVSNRGKGTFPTADASYHKGRGGPAASTFTPTSSQLIGSTYRGSPDREERRCRVWTPGTAWARVVSVRAA